MNTDSNESTPQVSELALDILNLERNSLIVNFRFLDRAISSLPFVEDENFSLASDGEAIYFSPWYILRRYKSERNVLVRDLFHIIMHNIMRHSFIGKDIEKARWDLACDIAVENALTEFSSAVLKARREDEQRATVALVKDEINLLTAEKIYKWLGDKAFSEEELKREREKFMADGHGLWYGSSDPEAKQDDKIKLKKLWEEISKRMQTELETMRNDKDSSLVQNLRSLNRTKYSYTEFLQRFLVQGEVMRLSDDEFDNNYYTYGLELFGNIPLVEPLEYCEQARIREFVIAIDTSGSVKGEVVQSFIQHTHDILSRKENFFKEFKLHIIQCDDRIRDDVLVTCKEEFDDYIKTMQINGLGRTDFRPVFRYTDELVARQEFLNLQGVLYFTDGDGVFPEWKPAYPVAFVLNDCPLSEDELPNWAMHINLSEEEILDRRLSDY